MLDFLFKKYESEYGPKSASCYRIFFALYAVFFRGQHAYAWISDYPDFAFNPPMLSFAVLFHGFPPAGFFACAELLIITLYICLAFGFCTNAVSFLLGLLIIICNSFAYSFGKIDHGILIEATLILMSFSGWGAYYSLDALLFKKKSKQIAGANSGYVFALLAMTVTFAYFTAGVQKLSWIDLKLGLSGVRWWMNTCYAMGRHDLLAGFFFKIHNAYFWEILDFLGVLFEISFLLAFLRPNYLRGYLSLAVGFHLMNYLMLNIPFVHHLVIFAAFLNWGNVSRILDRAVVPKVVWILSFVVAMVMPYILYLKDIPWPVIPDSFNIGEAQIDMILIQFSVAIVIIIAMTWKSMEKTLTRFIPAAKPSLL